jgi:hypothetical protein
MARSKKIKFEGMLALAEGICALLAHALEATYSKVRLLISVDASAAAVYTRCRCQMRCSCVSTLNG